MVRIMSLLLLLAWVLMSSPARAQNDPDECMSRTPNSGPQSLVVIEGQYATFSFRVTTIATTAAGYVVMRKLKNTVWEDVGRGFVATPGTMSYTTGPATIAMDGSQYQFLVRNKCGGLLSRIALLRVISGNICPNPNPSVNAAPNTACGLAVVGSSSTSTLARLGYGDADAAGNLILGTETFTLLSDRLGSPSGKPSWTTLFSTVDGVPRIYGYRTLIMASAYAPEVYADPEKLATLRAWVEGGGHLITSESMTNVEHLFPDALYWGVAGSPEAPTLEAGAGYYYPVFANITDPAMRTWLQTQECLRMTTNTVGTCFPAAEGTLAELSTANYGSGYDMGIGAYFQIKGGEGGFITGHVTFDGGVTYQPVTENTAYGASFIRGAGRVTYVSFELKPPFGYALGLTVHERILQYFTFVLN